MSTKSNEIGISVVVCTLNRSQLLRKCLESLTNQHLSISKYEVIVVDNCSTDDTDSVLQEFTSNQKNLRCFKEYQLGLSFARNRGWKEAVGKYVAFIDDDAVAYPDWLHQITLFAKRQPEIFVFGGPYEAYTVVTPPNWFPPEYGNFDCGLTERPLVHNEEWICGSNMIFLKDLLLRYSGFNELLGMKGNCVSYGEDTLLIQRLMDAGIIVYYVPTIKVMHLLPEYKMNLKWLLMASYRSGLNYEITFNKKYTFLDYIAIILKSLFRVLMCLLPPWRKLFRREIYYVLSPLFFGYGTLCEKIYELKAKFTRKVAI